MTMIQRPIFSLLVFAASLLFLIALNINGRPACSASQPAANSGGDKDAQAEQIKELQKQVAELQTQVNGLKSPRIVAAGTVTLQK
jgi:hypothetical protein